MSSLIESSDFNQEAINERLTQIKQECEEKGDEYAKQ